MGMVIQSRAIFKMDELDNMESDFSTRIDAVTQDKNHRGNCAHCNGAISIKEECLRANGKYYHPGHFFCAGCSQPIPSGQTYSIHPESSKPYHSECYEKKLDVCFKCAKPLLSGSIVTIDSARFHSDCFVCGVCISNESTAEGVGCGRSLLAEDKTVSYYAYQGTAICGGCYEESCLPRCTACQSKITTSQLPVKDAAEDGSRKIRFPTHQGQPYCIQCYEAKFVPDCHRCHEKIRPGNGDGTCLEVSGNKYHTNCFVCYDCGCAFEGNKAYAHNNGFYCRNDFERQSKGGQLAH